MSQTLEMGIREVTVPNLIKRLEEIGEVGDNSVVLDFLGMEVVVDAYSNLSITKTEWMKIKRAIESAYGRGGAGVFKAFQEDVNVKKAYKIQGKSMLEGGFKNYYIKDDHFWYIGSPMETPIKVSNFWCKIVSEVLRNGEERMYCIEGESVTDGAFSLEMSADDFHDNRRLKAAILTAAGTRSVLLGSAQQLESAIKTCTEETDVFKLYERTGWDGDKFVIPGMCGDDMRVELKSLAKYGVVDRDGRSGNLWIKYMRSLIEAIGAKYAVPAICSMFYSQLSAVIDYDLGSHVLFIAGESGSFKSSWTTAAMNMFLDPKDTIDRGRSFFKWGDTSGGSIPALMDSLTYSRDMPFLIDNYKPEEKPGAAGMVSIIHAVCEGAAKSRMTHGGLGRVDGEVVASTVVTNGEDFPTKDMAAIGRCILVTFPKSKGIPKQWDFLRDRTSSKMANTAGYKWISWLEKNKSAVREVYSDLIANRIVQKYEQAAMATVESERGNFKRIANNLTAVELTFTVMATLHPDFQEIMVDYWEDFYEGMAEIMAGLAKFSVSSDEGENFIGSLNNMVNNGEVHIYAPAHHPELSEWSQQERDRIVGWATETVVDHKKRTVVAIQVGKAKKMIERSIGYATVMTNERVAEKLANSGYVHRDDKGNALRRSFYVKEMKKGMTGCIVLTDKANVRVPVNI